MKNDAVSLWARRLLMLVIGTMVSQAGIQLFVALQIGSDPYMVFIQGVANIFGLSNGMAMNVVMIILMIALLLTTKGYIRPGTIVCTFCTGPVVSLYGNIYERILPEERSVFLYILLILAACVIAAFGLSIMLNSAAGACPNDLISVVLSDKIEKLEFRYARIIIDAAMVIIGMIMSLLASAEDVFGGIVGVGTLASVLLYGPIIQFFTKTAQKIAKGFRVNRAEENKRRSA